jgi:hypothetical protein
LADTVVVVRPVWGERAELPPEILEAVAAQARRLGRLIASDDLLLALTVLDEAQPARQALAAEGIEAERLQAAIRVGGDGPLEPPSGLLYAPAHYSMRGRADGFAATLGDGRIAPEHVLLALLWDPMSHSSQLLRRLGVSRGAGRRPAA